MIIGSVAKVLKNMASLTERRLADPVRPLAAHMGETLCLAAHPLHHVVAADPRIGAAALGQSGRAVMRTTRTEPRCSGGNLRCIIIAPHFGQPLQPGLDAFGPAALFDKNATDLLGDHDRIQRIARREQFLMCAIMFPAMNATAVAIVEDRLFQLHLDQLSLFLDTDDQFQILRPFLHGFHVQRPCLPDLVGGQAQPIGLGLVDAQQRQRMHQIQPVLAGSDKPDLGIGSAPMFSVDPVCAGKRFGRPSFIVDHPRFLRDGRVSQPNVQPAFGHVEFRRHEIDPVRIAIHHRRRLDRVFHRLEAGPDASEARQRKAVQPEIQNLLHTRG